MVGSIYKVLKSEPCALCGSGVTPSSHTGLKGVIFALAPRIVLLCVAYYFGTLLGYAFIFPGSYISVLWPPNTVLLVALLLSPARHWVWLLSSAYSVHIFAQMEAGTSIKGASLYYVYDCALVLLTAGAFRRVGLGDLALTDLRQALKFIAVTLVAGALAALVWSPLIVTIWQHRGNLWNQWGLVALSNLLPVLMAAPGLMLGFNHGRTIVKNASLAQLVEFPLLVLGLLVCAFAFGPLTQTLRNSPALFYTPLPLLLWTAVRFGPGGLSLSFSTFSLMAMVSAVAGYGPFIGQSPGDSVLRVQIFLLALYVPFLVLAAVVKERRSKEDALIKSEARYRAVVEDQTELICRFLPDGQYTFANEAFCKGFGRSREDVLNRTLWEILSPEGQQAARESIAAITPEQPAAIKEYRTEAPNGETRWKRWRSCGIFDDQRRIVEYQAVGRDISDQKRVEEAHQDLAHAQRLAVVGEFTAMMAHELRQPLGAILCDAKAGEILLESANPPLNEIREILSEIYKSDLRAEETIRHMQGLLRKREVQIERLDLNETVLQALQLVAGDALRRHVQVSSELAPNLPAVRGDRVHLQHVLLNLIANGMDAMKDTQDSSRQITVQTKLAGNDTVELTVADCGSGIAPDRMPQLFGSFYTTKKEGMGLGLSIAQRIIRAHNGRIWAENKTGGGAVFHFTLSSAGASSS